MALDAIYSTGTVSVAQGGTTVTGVGTNFVTALVRKGDLFANATLSAMAMVTDDPTSPTELKIEAWPGTSLSAGSPFKIIRLPDAVRMIEAYAKLAGVLVPNLTAFGDLQGAADKIPVFTGNDSAAARDIVGTVSQSGGIPTGAIIERGSNANGEYVRFADGTQICWKGFSPAGVATNIAYGSIFRSDTVSITFPATFAAIPSSSISWSDGRWGSAGATGVSGITNFMAFNASSSDTILSISFFAIGRWF